MSKLSRRARHLAPEAEAAVAENRVSDNRVPLERIVGGDRVPPSTTPSPAAARPITSRLLVT